MARAAFRVAADVDFDTWRTRFNMVGASDAKVRASIKKYCNQQMFNHLYTLGVLVPLEETKQGGCDES